MAATKRAPAAKKTSRASRGVYELVEVGERKQIRVELKEARGVEYVDVRNWYQNRDAEDSGEWLPGKGIWIPVEVAKKVMKAVGESLPQKSAKG
jgi:hypothetical protein